MGGSAEPVTVIRGRVYRLLVIPCVKCKGKGHRSAVDGNQLSTERSKAGVSVAAVAKRMKVTTTYVWMLETNQRVCSEVRAAKYLIALDAIVAARKEKK